jgi:hypothetical protein
VIVNRQRHVLLTCHVPPGDLRGERIEKGSRRLPEPSLTNQQIVEVEVNRGAAALMELVEHLRRRNVPWDR